MFHWLPLHLLCQHCLSVIHCWHPLCIRRLLLYIILHARYYRRWLLNRCCRLNMHMSERIMAKISNTAIHFFIDFMSTTFPIWSYLSAKLAAAAAVSFVEYNLILRSDPMKCNPGRRNLAFRGRGSSRSSIGFFLYKKEHSISILRMHQYFFCAIVQNSAHL